jgi:aconitase A
LTDLSTDRFRAHRSLPVAGRTFNCSIQAAEENGLQNGSRLPVSLNVLLENLLRFEGGRTVTMSRVTLFATLSVGITYGDGSRVDVPTRLRIDTIDELEYFRSGGILQSALRNLGAQAEASQGGQRHQ